MASSAYSTPMPAQQPGLNAFIVCDRLPEGCTAYVVPDNRQAPLLRAGEWVIVDPTDIEPVEGELFVIRWQSNPERPQVVECGIVDRITNCAGEPIWSVGARHRGVNAAALGFGQPGMIVGDFGYTSPMLSERFLGRVVGILEPVAHEPIRITA